MATAQTLLVGNTSSTPSPNLPSPSLYVGDLPYDVTESALHEIFNRAGSVTSVRICRHTITRASLGYGYVNFHTYKDAEKALDTLNYHPINGGQIRVMWSVRDPRLRKSGDGNVFVKNLDRSIDNKILHDRFSLFGNILSCKVAVDADGVSKGFGFVHYDSDESAAKAIEEMNGVSLGDSPIFVGAFKRQSERISAIDSKYTNLYVKHFPASWDQTKLEDVFSQYGKITSALVKSSKKQQPFAFINFETNEGAKAAVQKMNGQLLENEAIVEGQQMPDYDGIDKDGKERLYVAPHQGKSQRQAILKAQHTLNASVNGDGSTKSNGSNLYIKNFDESIDDDGLFKMFSVFGPVASAKVMRDGKGESLGYGFVSFVSAEDGTKAVTEMHAKVLHSKPLYVSILEPKDERRRRLMQHFSTTAVRAPMAGVTPPVVPFPGVPPVPYAAHNMNFAPRQVVAPYNPNIFQWKNYSPGGFLQQPMRPPINQMNFYSSVNIPGTMPDQNQPPQMNGTMNRGMRGNSRNAGVSYSSVASPGAKQVMPGMPKSINSGFKFTAQARNQMEAQSQQSIQQHDTTVVNTEAPLSPSFLTTLPPQAQKQLLGEKLFPRIAKFKPTLAGKVTGMMLEMENEELLHLLSDDVQLKTKVEEACKVLEEHQPSVVS